MKTNISFSKDNLMKAFKLHYNTKHPVSSRAMLIVGSIIMISGFFLFYIDFPKNPEYLKHVIVLAGFAYIVLFFYRRDKLYERASNQKSFEGDFTFDLNKKGISFGKGGRASQCNWSEIIEIVEDEETILFYFGKSKFYILPLEHINETQLSDVRKIISKQHEK